MENNSQEAELYMQKYLDGIIKCYGADSPNAAAAFNSVAQYQYGLQNWQKAIEYCDKSVSIYNDAYGKEKMYNFAPYILKERLKFQFASTVDEKEEAINSLLEIKDKVQTLLNNESHPFVGQIWNVIGMGYLAAGNAEQSVDAFEAFLRCQVNYYGESHTSVGFAYSNIADVYMNTKNFDDADSLYTKSMEIFKNQYGESHEYLIKPYIGRAQVRMVRNDADALQYFDKALEISDTCEKWYGKYHIQIYFMKAIYDMQKLNKVSMKENVNKCLNALDNNVKFDALNKANMYFSISQLFYNNGEKTKAKKYLKRAYETVCSIETNEAKNIANQLKMMLDSFN